MDTITEKKARAAKSNMKKTMEQELREMGLSWVVARKLSRKGSGKVLWPYASLGEKTIEPASDWKWI